MVMHARKHLRLDGYFDRNQTHSYENSGGKYSKSPFGDSCNDKSPAAENAASMAAAMDSPENSRRPSPRYPHKASYTQRLKERDHHHEVKSPMSKERSNRSRDHSHHHSSSSSLQHHGQQSNSTPGSSRKQSSSSTSETSTSNYARSNHDRSHVAEVKMEPEKERKGQVGDWSEHVSSSGKKYYYNCRTEVSQWEKPREWVEYEKIHGINKSAEIPNKSKEKNSGITPNKGSERHSNSNSRSNIPSRPSQHHQQHASHPQRGSHSHTHRHERSHQSASNRSHGNDQRNADQASSASSSSSNSSNSSTSSASAIRASAGTARNSGRRDDNKPVSRSVETLVEVSSEKSESRLNDHGASSRQESSSNHHSNYHIHHHNSGGSSSNKRSIARKDSSQDMDISPDSSFSTENNNFSSTGRETPRSHQYHPQHISSHPHQQQQQTPLSGASSTPGRMPKSGNGNFYVSTQSAMTATNHSLVAASNPSINSAANSQLLSPSQVTLANLPRLISQLTGTRGLPNLSEMSQQEALQTVQQALQLTKQLGGLSRFPHGASSNLDSKNALALSPALLSAAAALRDGQTGNQINFYPLGSEGGRMDSSVRGTAGCLSPSSDFHSHSSRQTSPASSAGSPTSVSVTVNSNSSNVTTSVAAAMAAAAAAANSGGSLSSSVSLKPSTPSLTPSLANYYREDLVTHVTGWQADHAERQASRYSEEAHNIGSLNCTRVSAELKMARSLVRLAEIQATLQEQRILFLRQQVKELEAKTNCRQNSFMMDS